MFDTGSTYSLINEEIARAVADPVEIVEPKRFEAAVGSFVVRQGVFADVLIKHRRYPAQFYVAPGLTESLIIGADFMQVWHIQLDPRKRRVILDPKAMKLKAVGSRLRPR